MTGGEGAGSSDEVVLQSIRVLAGPGRVRRRAPDGGAGARALRPDHAHNAPPPASTDRGSAVRPAGAGAGWRLRRLPGLRLLRHYPRAWLPPRPDGRTPALTAVLVPVGIATPWPRGCRASRGLYAAMAALLAYALFGPSRVLVLGRTLRLAALIRPSCCRCRPATQRAVALAGRWPGVGRAVHRRPALARLGFVTRALLSSPSRYGYMNSIALTVIASQLPACSASPSRAGAARPVPTVHCEAVGAGRTRPWALAIGLATLAVILLLRRHPAPAGRADRRGRCHRRRQRRRTRPTRRRARARPYAAAGPPVSRCPWWASRTSAAGADGRAGR